MSLELRRYTQADLPALAALFGDPQVMRYVADGRPLEAHESAQLLGKILDIYKTDTAFFVWTIEDGGEYAGHAELKRRKGRQEYELIYFLQPCRWGRGLGGRVVDLLLKQARERAIPFVIATVDSRNAASIAILLRRGFQPNERLSAELDCPAYSLTL